MENQTPETIALLKILELGEKQIQEGNVKPMSEVFAKLNTKPNKKALPVS
jgi:hypothetical protein